MTQPAPPEAMQRILATVRSRGLDEGAVLCAATLATYPQDSRLMALGGAIELQRGQFDRAAALLEDAHRAAPADGTVRANLAEARYHTGARDRALALCDDAAIAADPSGRLLRLGAFLAQETGNFDRAVTLYRRIVAAEPQDWSSWNNLGNALGPMGDRAGAVEALRQAAALAPDSGPIQVNLANALFAAGDFPAAETLLRGMEADDSADPTPSLTLFAMYRQQGREDESYAAIAEAARRNPDHAETRSDYAQEAAKRNDYAVAEAEFNAALALNPRLGPAIVGMASMLERMNREDELAPLLDRAGASGVDAESLSYITAMILRRAGKFDEALAALDASNEVVVPGRRYHLRGVLLDRLGRHEEAFAAWQAMNQHWLEDPTRPRQRAQFYRDSVAADMAQLSPAWRDSWTPPPADDGLPDPVVLLGFPRSGTTLLDTMLMREPRALVMEEEPFMTELAVRHGGVAALAGLDQAALADGRQFYFDRVRTLGRVGADTLVVDKHPLHLNAVATIQRFFPKARFVLALRHPVDVLLSCYLTNFRINNAMANFLDLGDAAATYDLTFRHWEAARALFDLPVHTVVYERLVEDTPRELRPLFAGLGLAWPGDDTDHRDAARARGVVYTASYAQVTEPIYQRARGRWHSYRDQLAPVLDTLRPWVDRFGYSLDDGRIPPWPDADSRA